MRAIPGVYDCAGHADKRPELSGVGPSPDGAVRPAPPDDKDTGLAKLPFKAFALNQVWLEIVALAHDLIVWTQTLLLDGELATTEPKRLRYRLLHVAARLAFSGRRGKLHLQRTWPWTAQLAAAFRRLKTLPVAAG
jgi:hypothetical protein